jgi:biopolymer transport protein ExbD
MIFKRSASEINAGSMADIAFLLLIFFLVTTTMDVDAGITRKLPPFEEPLLPQANTIHKRNIFTVLVNADNQLLVEGDYLELKDLRTKAKAFISNNGDGSCTYCMNAAGLSNSSDNPQKAVISLQNDRATDYKTYIAVQNELAAAYNELRAELGQERFGRKLGDLNTQEMNELKAAFPQVISEAEPVGF